MNRTEFQELAKLRLRESKALLDAGHYPGSYYLAGYAIECALKACIAKQTRRYDFPPGKNVIGNIYTHDLKTLMKSANLWLQFQKDSRADPALASYWKVIEGWSSEQRYELNVTRPMAADFYKAIAARTHGVLSWLKKYW